MPDVGTWTAPTAVLGDFRLALLERLLPAFIEAAFASLRRDLERAAAQGADTAQRGAWAGGGCAADFAAEAAGEPAVPGAAAAGPAGKVAAPDAGSSAIGGETADATNPRTTETVVHGADAVDTLGSPPAAPAAVGSGGACRSGGGPLLSAAPAAEPYAASSSGLRPKPTVAKTEVPFSAIQEAECKEAELERADAQKTRLAAASSSVWRPLEARRCCLAEGGAERGGAFSRLAEGTPGHALSRRAEDLGRVTLDPSDKPDLAAKPASVEGAGASDVPRAQPEFPRLAEVETSGGPWEVAGLVFCARFDSGNLASVAQSGRWPASAAESASAEESCQAMGTTEEQYPSNSEISRAESELQAALLTRDVPRLRRATDEAEYNMVDTAMIARARSKLMELESQVGKLRTQLADLEITRARTKLMDQEDGPGEPLMDVVLEEPAINHFDIRIRADCEGTPFLQETCQWFHFRMQGVVPSSTPLRFRVLGLSRFSGIVDNNSPILTDGLMPVVRSLPSQPNWQYINGRIGVQRLPGGNVAFTFEHLLTPGADNELRQEVYFAATFPYPLCRVASHAGQLSRRLADEGLYVHREHLCNSLGGRAIDLLTFTDKSKQSDTRQPRLPGLRAVGDRPHIFPGKRAVFVSSRVHPGEAPASFILEGLLDFLASGSEEAHVLLERYVFHIVPVLNPDGVELGHHRTDLRGENLNRMYGHRASLDLHPAVFAAQAACIGAHRNQGRLRLYLDLHAHGTRRGQFLLGETAGEGQAEAKLYAHALGWRCGTFEYAQSDFSHSCPGSGKSEIARLTGAPLCFTVESNYYRGHQSDRLYGPSDWWNFGRQLLRALLDVDSLENPSPGGALEAHLFENLLDAQLAIGGTPAECSRPGRTRPQFAKVLEVDDDAGPSEPADLVDKVVEIVDARAGTTAECVEAYRLHQCHGGEWVVASRVKMEWVPTQMGQFYYGVLRRAAVTRYPDPGSDRVVSQLGAGTVILAVERCVAKGLLRVRIGAVLTGQARDPAGGWVSEFVEDPPPGVGWDPRLGAPAQLLRLRGPPPPPEPEAGRLRYFANVSNCEEYCVALLSNAILEEMAPLSLESQSNRCEVRKIIQDIATFKHQSHQKT